MSSTLKHGCNDPVHTHRELDQFSMSNVTASETRPSDRLRSCPGLGREQNLITILNSTQNRVRYVLRYNLAGKSNHIIKRRYCREIATLYYHWSVCMFIVTLNPRPGASPQQEHNQEQIWLRWQYMSLMTAFKFSPLRHLNHINLKLVQHDLYGISLDVAEKEPNTTGGS